MTLTGSSTVPALDEKLVEQFSEQLLGTYVGAFVTSMIDLGHRTGLFEHAARGPADSPDLARRAGLEERYVREWLGAMVTAGIVDYDPAGGVYSLPTEHAVCLTGDGELNLAPLSQIHAHLASFVEPVAVAFREGGGVTYAAYRPEFTDLMDGLNRGLFDGVLVEGVVPLVEGLAEQLARGVDVIDVGCGTGHSTNLLAEAFPGSRFVGYDLAEDAISHARGEAAAYELDNVRFEVLDVLQLPTDPPVDAVFAFDAIHDQVDPAGVLRRIFDVLAPGGVFVMFDIRASSRLEDNCDNPMAPMLYGISTLHCMTVSLAEGGAGLGTVWGEELALEMLRAAGFVDLEVHEAPGDPVDSVYVARKPA